MKYVICAIRDSALDAFSTPMFTVSKGQAIRSFTDEVQRVADGNMYNLHPECFELFFIGEYFDSDGTFKIESSPSSLIRALDCVKVKN